MEPSGRERRGATLERDGERIYYEVTGQGPTVVLCHGLAGNHAMWWQQVDALAQDHQVVTWDQRGFGNSTAGSGRTGFDAAAEDLWAILNALDVTVAHLVGQSMGGFTALRAALEQPLRVGSLTLSTTAAAAPQFTPTPSFPPEQAAWRDRHPVLSAGFSAAHPELVVLYNAISSLGATIGVTEMLAHMAAERHDPAALLALAAPVSVIAAELDEYCPAAVLEQTAARFTAAAYEVLPRASHSAYYETPGPWNAAVIRALQRAGA